MVDLRLHVRLRCVRLCAAHHHRGGGAGTDHGAAALQAADRLAVPRFHRGVCGRTVAGRRARSALRAARGVHGGRPARRDRDPRHGALALCGRRCRAAWRSAHRASPARTRAGADLPGVRDGGRALVPVAPVRARQRHDLIWDVARWSADAATAGRDDRRARLAAGHPPHRPPAAPADGPLVAFRARPAAAARTGHARRARRAR